MSNTKITFLAKRLKQAREDLGYSQKKMGEILELSDKAVSSYEVGRAAPSIETLQEYSQMTHRPVSYFLDESDQDNIDLQLKINSIERELLEVKKLLEKKGNF
ncbi:MAG: helix-turn-helix transcriptional regulator [Candidatus Pacebacteria bacterium]|jgi:repressor LexA|nr:helix-turn-helix transcriptional regulator [Candidatus Paceibacterota bacterium]MBT4652731.1 helix-turn-helix transcriptional regulator [Candidatus Paceibacterota bacterium]MBT6755888.1 helix-turn-helix transcriptional regulator [Candidatus Paceibacterota bacterium]MBT6921101.1 helix-turn-helix transcriptional regulator [Candidatus Paceibacterota bacterium]